MSFSGRRELNHRIIFPRKGEVALEAFELADVGENDVRVESLYSLISIGTESTILHHRYDPDTHFARQFSFPQLQTGNQTVGFVEAIGANVTSPACGDYVFIRKGHASAWVMPADDCSPIPALLDLKHASWCGMAKIAFRAAEEAPFRLGGCALIVGAGPVGQMAVRWAKLAGMAQIVVSDLSAQRLHLAGEGVDCLEGALADRFSEASALTAGEGFEIVIDTTGNAAVFQTALSLSRRFGKVVLLGDTGYPTQQRLTSDMMNKGVSVVATHESLDRHGWTERDIDQLFFKHVKSGAFDLRNLISHEFSPHQCVDAYRLVTDHRDEVTGAIFDWT